MRYIHPRRLFRKVRQLFLKGKASISRALFLMNCRSHHVKCRLGENCLIQGCRILTHSKAELVIGDGCTIKHCFFGFTEKHGRIEIAKNVVINGHSFAPTILHVREETVVSIGEDTIISNRVEISTTDWHWMVDEEGTILNKDRDVRIGNHVWIGRRVLIGKGVTIGDGSVVGAGSIVTKSFPESNLLLAGNPAIVKRQGVHWKH